MAKQTTVNAIDPTLIDDDGQYRVVLAERIVVDGVVLYPGWDIILKGDVVKSNREAIEHADPI
ncbi:MULTISPECIES: hypothetical protein [Methylococcus]|uniref:Uncharacterized protein n=1 Tax=Methylococcus capsulatus (strain ATCC 33009 / NCIMB 11132 / Bath) TaxID=243233 RepID=Q603A4_METCA|nr:hypothetical protein [Methylococcus capsulatus]AAU91013.1 hypothetical protein MCA2903 [Methylococcus capsulatus str. Bath]QXP93064.1 hypothetical protein KW113_11925 [Methylococcus capsulatus]